jgi:hypothetical protein
MHVFVFTQGKRNSSLSKVAHLITAIPTPVLAKINKSAKGAYLSAKFSIFSH